MSAINRRCLVAATAVISAVLANIAQGQDARLQGVFVNPAQSEGPIKAAVDAAAAQFNFLLRPVARNRMKKTNPNITRVEITHSGEDITIKLGASKSSTASPGGPPIKWSRDDEVFDLALTWEGTTLVQSFVAPDGKRFNRYTLSPDGNTLSLEITLASDMLKQPVKYTLTFSREANRQDNK